MAGSRLNIKNYDIKYKIELCEEYLELLSQGLSTSKRQFATDKGVKPTTFYDWINAYLKYQAKNGDDGVIVTSTNNNEESSLPKFIQISEEPTIPITPTVKDNKVILRYKDVSLEFDEANIDKALEIIRRW